ncbi:hypothetical protein G6F56_005859 [Rhizopus delemar]|nr:hypothetical protein G6F56_005859 [Rhizopus delemar]
MPGNNTFYEVGLGSCGNTNSYSELVTALSFSLMQSSSYNGQSITINSAGKSVTVKAVDFCPGCAQEDLDLRPAVLRKLSPMDRGRISIIWSF